MIHPAGIQSIDAPVLNMDVASCASPLGAIALWRIDLDDARLDDDSFVLSNEENDRADRFVNPLHGVRYRRAHVALRSILAGRVRRPAQSLRFAANAFGKPYLVSESAGAASCFNLSHSDSSALIAVSDELDVGVDIEVLRTIKGLDDLARTQLSAYERSRWLACDISQRDEAFLRCWTRKEAVLKAIGCGLNIDAAQVDVGLGSPCHALHAIRWEAPTALESASRDVVALCSIPVGSGAVASLAYRHSVSEPR